MKKKRFGRTDYRVSELCLSTSNFARYADREESFAILDAFREAGGNFVQTSGICPGVSLGDGFLGMPEEALGHWLKQRRINRAHIVIATRIALTRPIIGGIVTYTKLLRDCAQDSIRRMGCGFLDFLVVEWTDAIAPVRESVTVFDAAIASGEIRHIVPANFPSRIALEILAASGVEPRTIGGLQLDYSLAARPDFEAGAAKLCADHGLAAITRSPLAGGHLAIRKPAPSFGALRHRGANDRIAAMGAEDIWPVLFATARERRRSPAQVALGWVLAHPQVTSVLISVSSVAQLQELIASTRLTLGCDDIARLGGRSLRHPNTGLAS